MSRGRKRTPTEVLTSSGSWRANTAERENEPKLEPGTPDKPDWLPKYAQEEWDYYIPILQQMRVLTQAERGVLTNLCIAQAQVRTINDVFTAPGFCELDKTLRAQRQAINEANRCLSELGLTPASRSKCTRAKTREPTGGEVVKGLLNKMGKSGAKN